ncbi:MAG: glycosyltransferase family 2 protein, partial [Bdellovibrionales bacterium]
VYKEGRNIQEFLRRMIPLLEQTAHDFEIIFAMDPSPDDTEEVLIRAHQADPRVRFLKFSKRVGQPMATLAGMEHSSGDAVIVMDVDLQDPPELIPQMIAKWKEGYDVVYAQRTNRKGETLMKRFVSWLGYMVINQVADVEIPRNTGDFRLMSRRVVEQVVALKESHGFLRGLVALVGFKQTAVLFERPARFAGKGNYNRWFGSLKIGLNGIICFSNFLLKLATSFGFVVAVAAFLMAIIYFILKIRGVPFPLGNPTIVILVLFLGGVQLMSIGILGEYIGRIYDEVKARPKYILDKKIGFS